MARWMLVVYLVVGYAFAQDPNAMTADRVDLSTRASQIESARQQKAAALAPDKPQGVEHALDVFEEKEILQRLTEGVAGFRVHLGGLITGSGFAAGPEYYRHLVHDQVTLRASLRASLRKYYLMDEELSAPHLAEDHAFVNLYAVHYDYPDMDYYGPGPNSKKPGGGKLTFDDLAARYGFRRAPVYSVQWFEYDNRTGARTPISQAATFDVPRAQATYLAATIQAGDPRKTVTVYVHDDCVVGIDRTW